MINQETLDEHCRDLADQLCKSPAVTGSGKLPRRVTGVGLVRPDVKTRLRQTKLPEYAVLPTSGRLIFVNVLNGVGMLM